MSELLPSSSMFHININIFPYLWPYCLDMLKPAMERDDWSYTPELLHKAVKENKMQLWVVGDDAGFVKSSIITEIKTRPIGKVLVARYLGGVDAELWIKYANDVLKKFAKDHDCVKIEAYGRLGWRKMAKLSGWKEKSILFQLDLDFNVH